MSTLPGIYAPIECGHCFTALDFEDYWSCPKCGLSWPSANPYDEVDAVFTDDEAEPCGRISSAERREHDGHRFWDEPCTLPAGHETGKHFHPLSFEKLEDADEVAP